MGGVVYGLTQGNWKQGAKDVNAVSPHSWFLSKKQSASMDLGGQLLGAHDDLYKPAKVEPIPQTDTTNDAMAASDRARRLARKAAGLQSTIRTSPSGAAALYSSQPKALLGS